MPSQTAPSDRQKRSRFWWRVLRLPLDVLVIGVIVLDDAVRPLYRPLACWINQLRSMRAIEGGVARLPPYAALVALGAPFAVAEPLKIAALYWMGTGHKVMGLGALVLAYAASFVIVERVYHAGRPQLLTIGWFAKAMAFTANLKNSIMQHLRATRFWRVGEELAAFAKTLIRKRLRRQEEPG